MKYGSLCSGIEAATVAWEHLGFTPLWFAEIEAFPSAVLAHHWPDVPNLGDMTKLVGRILSGDIPAPDILVGGTPCQAFSVAGLRGSLEDERGNLTLVLVRILDAIDFIRQRNNAPPCTLVWENVPGVLSTKDNAFGCFLGGLAGEDEALQPTGQKWTNAGLVSGHARRIGWRVLDAQYFGVPQRRRRVFLIASAGNIDIATILFERESLCRNFAPCRNTQKKSTTDVKTGFIETGFAEYKKSIVGGTLRANGGTLMGGSETLVIDSNRTSFTAAGFGSYEESNVSSTLLADGYSNHGGSECLIVCNGRQDPVRKLTPLECERLQGFPDNHTKIPWRGKPAEACPDAPRYKAIGNSMAVPVMRWIGKRIALFGTKNDAAAT